MAQYTVRQVFGDEGLGSISGVVSSLPVGATLGDERMHNGVQYRLMFNSGNSQISPGFIGSPKSLASGAVNTGPYSCTVSSVSQTGHALGAVVCVNATATTGTYFWGAFRGYPVKLAGNVNSYASGTRLMVGDNGGVCTNVTGATAQVIQPDAACYVVATVIGQAYSGIASTTTGLATVMTGVPSGDCFVSFPDFQF